MASGINASISSFKVPASAMPNEVDHESVQKNNNNNKNKTTIENR